MHLFIVFTLLVVLNASNGAPSENRVSLVDPHIVGGSDIGIEKAPYQISIELFRWHICGGAIISEKWALTTAQCAQSSGPLWATRIRAGSTTSIPLVGWGGSIHKIDEVGAHPRYNARQIDYDVAVIKVTNDFVRSDRVTPVSLPRIGQSEHLVIDYAKNATVTGWGLTQDGGWFRPWNLKRHEIVLTPRIYCAERFKEAGMEVPITSRVICGAGNGEGGPCKGDNGGPLVHEGMLIGLTSWVKGKCNDPRLPAGFTNLVNEEVRSFVKTRTDL